MRIASVLSDAWQGIRRNLSVTMSVVLVTAVSVVLLGVAGLAWRQADLIRTTVYDQVQVQIYLCPKNSPKAACQDGAVTDEQRDNIEQQLEEMKPLVTSVEFVSEQQAFDRFQQDNEDSPLANNVVVGDLPSSYRVQLSDPEKYQVVAETFQNAPGVSSIPNVREIFAPVLKIIGFMQWGAFGLAVLALVSAVLLLVTTVHQAAVTRRREIAIMRLVGASNATIRAPFVVEAIITSLIGVILATGLLWGAAVVVLDRYFRQQVATVPRISSADVLALAPVLGLGVVVLAAVTATIAIWRYLRV